MATAGRWPPPPPRPRVRIAPPAGAAAGIGAYYRANVRTRLHGVGGDDGQRRRATLSAVIF